MDDQLLIQIMSGYVPRLIQNQIASDPTPISIPHEENFDAVLLFVDISGFTLLTEQLAASSPEGAERLADLLNEYFGQLIDVIYQSGGDVAKFAGDALLSVWRLGGLIQSYQQAALIATACALKIRFFLDDYSLPEINLRIKIAVSAGRIVQVHIGGEFNRWEFLLVGDPLAELGYANQNAQAGDILLAPSVWEILQNDIKGVSVPFVIKGEARFGVRLEKLIRPAPGEIQNEPVPNMKISVAALRSYIPGAILSRLSAGQSDWLAELRRVSVLFINLPDLNQDMQLADAQQLARLIQLAVYRFEGSINKINVDDKGITLVAATGLPPLSHQDDPLRAVRIALEIRDQLNTLNLHSAIGISTARIFCGSIGNATRREYTLLGDGVNLAARLMELSANLPDLLERHRVPILCDRVTHDAAKSAIDFDALPSLIVKGKSEPIEIFYPCSEFQANVLVTSSLIGREKERAQLTVALDVALHSQKAKLVVLSGEPGIGKSRLATDLIREGRERRIDVLIGASDPIDKGTPYHAWRPVFTHLFGLADFISLHKGETQLAMASASILETLHSVDPGLVRYAPLLNVLFPVDIAETELTVAMSGETRAGNTRAMLVQLLQYRAGMRPMIIVLEDLHWFDSSSWALVYDVLQNLKPLLLLLTTRPLIEPLPDEYKRMIQEPSTEVIQIEALPVENIDELVCARLMVDSISPQISQMIRQKSEGNPFFAEELALALRDSGAILIEDKQSPLALQIPNIGQIRLPDTLAAAITSRIDSLIPSQQLTLKVASVIGRSFAFRLLTAAYPLENDKPLLGEYVEKLADLSLILPEMYVPELTYIFKHAVTQEVVYNLMLLAQRRQLHQAVAEWIEENYQLDSGANITQLAYHWSHSLDERGASNQKQAVAKAIYYLEKAGDQALNGFANLEAIDFFQKDQELVEFVPVSNLQRAQWNRKIGQAHLGLGQLVEARRFFSEGLSILGRRFPQTAQGLLFSLLAQVGRQAMHRMWSKVFRNSSFKSNEEARDMETVRVYLQQAVALFLINNPLAMFYSVLANLNTAERMPDTPELGYVYAQVSAICGFIPLRGQAKYYGRKSREIEGKFNHLGYTIGSAISLATMESGIGLWDELTERLTRVAAICEELGDNRQRGEALSFLVSNAIVQGDADLALANNERLRENSFRGKNPVQRVWVHQWDAGVALYRGEWQQVLDSCQQALALMADQPVGEVSEYVVHGLMAYANLQTGNPAGIKIALELCARAAKSTAVDYSVYIGYLPIAETLFTAWQVAEQDGSYQSWSVVELSAASRQMAAVIRKYSRVFTVGGPLMRRLKGLDAWRARRRGQAYHYWEQAIEQADRLQMPYEAGRSHLELLRCLPGGHPKRELHYEQARTLFTRLNLANWVYEVEKAKQAVSV